MHAWVRRALCAAGLAGGTVLLGIGLAEAASADDGPVTTGESAILSGNQAGVDADAPINLSGNQVTAIGQGNTSTSTSGASTAADDSGSPTTSGEDGIGSGNQVDVDADAPVNASGNQVTVIGQDNESSSVGGATTGGSGDGAGDPTTTGEDGIGSGNQLGLDADAPINLSGNQVTVIGQDNQSTALGGATTGGSSGGSADGPGAGPTTTGEGGLLSGNQALVGLEIPVNVSGDQVTVIGQDNTLQSLGGSTTEGSGSSGGPGTMTTSGEDGLLSGNQLPIGVQVPVGATGDQVTVVGQDNELTSTGGSSTGTTGGGDQTTTGEGGVGSGNQIPIDVQVPVDSSGNQVAVVGEGNTNTSTGGSSTNPPGATTPPGVTVPPTTIVSPPTSGGAPSAPQGAGGPGDTVLPDTGASRDLLGLGVLGLILLTIGLVLGRPRRLTVR